MSRPLLIVSLPLALGAAAGSGLATGAAIVLLVLAAFLLLLCLAATPRAAGAGLLCAALAIGAAGAAVESASYLSAPLRAWLETAGEEAGPVLIKGAAAGEPRATGERVSMVLEVESLTVGGRERPARGRARVEVGGSSAAVPVEEGDRVALWAHLRLPMGLGNPGSFGIEAQARREGIHAMGYCKSALLLSRQGARSGGGLRAAAARARAWTRRQLLQAVLPGPEQGVVRAMVLGDRTGLGRETAETLRAAGTYHVLAISGAQVALVAAILMWAVRRLQIPPLPAAVAVCGALSFYALFVGGEVPVTRAAAMAIVLVAGRCLDLDSDLANLLGLAGGVLLVHRPSAVSDVAFQLSFAATLGLLLLTPPLLKRWPPLPLRLELGLAASIAAQGALAPLLILHFHRLAPAALVLNLLAVPLSALVLMAGLGAALGWSVLPALGRLLGDLSWMGAHALLRSGELVRLAPALDVRLPNPPWWAVTVFVAGLVALSRPALTRAAWILSGVGLAGLVLGRGPTPGDGRLHLTVLDVGQGDCMVVRSPRGRLWLVDAGGWPAGSAEVGEAVVGPYLWSEGARRLQGMVLTHAHPDHVGGVPFLLRAFPTGEVWEGVAPRHDPGYRGCDEGLRAAKVARRAVSRGVRGEWDGVEIEVMGPEGGPPPRKTRNDDSVVLALRLGEVRLLLAGDIEKDGEARLQAGRAQLLKVPHHGSRSSSGASLLREVGPQVAVVSAGRRNRFGHPHPEVLQRYARAGVRLFRTDRDGAVTLSTDGARIWVRSFRGEGFYIDPARP